MNLIKNGKIFIPFFMIYYENCVDVIWIKTVQI